MFFVGATGQLLTLILTVCLPFVFLVSGHQKLEVQSPTNFFTVQQNIQEISSVEVISFNYNDDLILEKRNYHFEFEDIPTIQKFPFDNFLVKWKSVYSTSSGNKAPPAIPCFFC